MSRQIDQEIIKATDELKKDVTLTTEIITGNEHTVVEVAPGNDVRSPKKMIEDCYQETQQEIEQRFGSLEQAVNKATTEADRAGQSADAAAAEWPKVTAEGNKQIKAVIDQGTLTMGEVKTEGGKQVSAATAQANRAANKASASEASAADAANSAVAARESASHAGASQQAAAASANNASANEQGAGQSEEQASASAASASASASAARASETAAAASATAAKASETAAYNAKTATKNSENNAAISAATATEQASAAKASATKAKASETVAASSASQAGGSATSAGNSATNALNSANKAKASETAAQQAASTAQTSEQNAEENAANAKGSETAAADSASTATQQADRSESEADRAKAEADRAVKASRRIVGEICRFSFDTPPAGFFALDGSTIPNGKIDFPALAKSGSRFITISGNNIVLKNFVDFGRGKGSSNRAIGGSQNDAIRQIFGEIKSFFNNQNSFGAGGTIAPVVTYSPLTGAFTHGNYHNYSQRIGGSENQANQGRTIIFDSARAVPTDSENRPKSLTELVCIYHGVI